MNDFGRAIGAIATAIIGVAIVAVLVSSRSQTAGVLTAAFGGFSRILSVAVSPVAGGGDTGGVQQSAAAFGSLGSDSSAYPFAFNSDTSGANGLSGLATSPYVAMAAKYAGGAAANSFGSWLNSGSGDASGGGGFSTVDVGSGSDASFFGGSDWGSSSGDIAAGWYG